MLHNRLGWETFRDEGANAVLRILMIGRDFHADVAFI